MLLETFTKSVIEEYTLEYINEHSCTLTEAHAALEQYAKEMYMQTIQSNPEYATYLKLRNHSYCYNTETDEIFRIIEINPLDIKLKSPNGTVQNMDQKFLQNLIPLTPTEVKTRLGFLALSKNKSNVHNVVKIEGTDFRTRNILVFIGDLNKAKPARNNSFKDHRMMNIHDFMKDYEVVIQTEYLDFVA